MASDGEAQARHRPALIVAATRIARILDSSSHGHVRCLLEHPSIAEPMSDTAGHAPQRAQRA